MEFALPDVVKQLLLFAPVFILSLTFHEFAHAWVADRLGDSTARYLGRLTMDPMAHLSWLGTVIIPAVAMVMGLPLFGWANPVPVDMRNFKKPFPHMAIVAAAGPLSNIGIATLMAGVLSLVVRFYGSEVGADGHLVGVASAAIFMLVIGVQLNLFLAFFNLLPFPPLDGGRILQGLVPPRVALKIEAISGQFQIFLLLLILMGGLNWLARPVMAIGNWLLASFGVPVQL